MEAEREDRMSRMECGEGGVEFGPRGSGPEGWEEQESQLEYV